MDKKIIKSEILLTRRCNLNCAYCGITDKKLHKEELDLKGWQEALKAVTSIGSGFNALYGGEPLLRYEDLMLPLIPWMNKEKIHYSFISNCIQLSIRRVRELLDVKLDSLTVSIDSLQKNEIDSPTSSRTNASLQALEMFEGKVRDLEVSITIGKHNLLELPMIVAYFSKRGIWTTFDFIHYIPEGDTVTTKRVSKEDAKDYLLELRDMPMIIEIGHVLKRMAQLGCLIHQPPGWFDTWNQMNIIDQTWHCKDKDPSFVSIDTDGSLMVCDDVPGPNVSKFYAWDLPTKWDQFLEAWHEDVKSCPGCFWSTHIMSREMVNTANGVKHFVHKANWGE